MIGALLPCYKGEQAVDACLGVVLEASSSLSGVAAPMRLDQVPDRQRSRVDPEPDAGTGSGKASLTASASEGYDGTPAAPSTSVPGLSPRGGGARWRRKLGVNRRRRVMA